MPLTTNDAWVRELSGITVPDVACNLLPSDAGKPLDRRRGSLLFTHFGLSGPVVLDISRSFTALSRIRLGEAGLRFSARYARRATRQ